jgi:hypothetical protein
MKFSVIVLVMVLSGLLAQTASAEVYRWTDKDGHTYYSDNPPPEAGADIRKLHDNHISVDKLSYELQQVVKKFPLTLYVDTSGNDACTQARTWLQQRKIPYSEKVIKNQAELDAFKSLTGNPNSIVPSLAVGSKIVEGFESNAWGTALEAAGYPKQSTH